MPAGQTATNVVGRTNEAPGSKVVNISAFSAAHSYPVAPIVDSKCQSHHIHDTLFTWVYNG